MRHGEEAGALSLFNGLKSGKYWHMLSFSISK
jgi:hypothetical protein